MNNLYQMFCSTRLYSNSRHANIFLFPVTVYRTGPERRSAEIDKKNKVITAYHESGHAIIAYYTKDAMPINKATIMPRGPTLGHVS